MTSDPIDVVIVGAGPTGLTAAHLCRRLGLSAVVLERRDGPQRAPAAHVINGRTFEIWRQTGVNVDALLVDALPPAEAGLAHWAVSLGGQVIGSLPFERQGVDMLEITPTPLRNLSQHRLEPKLLAEGLDVRYSHRWDRSDDLADGVHVVVEGPDGEYTIDARYQLAADGAASGVRRQLGIEMDGPRSLQSFVMVHLAADFGPLVGDCPGVLWFIVDPASGGTFISHGIDREWVYMHAWDPDTVPIESFTPERGAELVRAALARPDTPFEVLGTSTWHMSAQVSPRYRSGRTFLVGDAAHRFPPTGGLGLNTGVADVHNLVWKIAAVESDRLPASVLDTYESERRPVARFNCDQSMANAFKLIEVPIAFGFTGDVAESTAALDATLADPTRLASVRAAIAAQAIHFDLLGLQLGACYEGPLVIDDGTPVVMADEPARDYLPSTRPGGRLPHAWLAPGVSTLDLVDPTTFTVLVREGAEAPEIDDARVTAVAAPVWDDRLALAPEQALVVRPDQHIAFRGPLAEVGTAVAALVSGGMPG
jgi:2,4-dichlorophenol 6-monooxygenase